MRNTIHRTGLAFVLLATVAGPRAVAAGRGWTQDVRLALKVAARQGKDLLLNFTGSDWCPYCIKLEQEVFSRPPFTTEAPRKFVLVLLDFPRRTSQSAGLKQQNRQLQEKLGVTGFPTVYLVDSKGMPYAKTGYFAGGSAAWTKNLNVLQQRRIRRDKLLAQAAKAKGLARAKLLDQAISLMDKAIVTSFYGKIITEIIKLDPKNEAGLKTKYAGDRILAEVLQKVNKSLRRRKTKDALKAIDDAIKQLKPTGTVGQELYYMKATVLYRSRDRAGAQAVLKRAYDMAPATARAREIAEAMRNFTRKRS